MTEKSDAFDGECPCCGHVFRLADLSYMAVGGGYNRGIKTKFTKGENAGKFAVVWFTDFNPAEMIEAPLGEWIAELEANGGKWEGERPPSLPVESK